VPAGPPGGTWRHHGPGWALAALWATVIIAPITLVWAAQRQFAHTALHIPDGAAWLFPLAIETGAWVCAFEAHRRARAGAPATGLVPSMWLLSAIAASINFAHGLTDGGIVAGLSLSALSVLGVLLHHIRTRAHQAHTAGRTAADLRAAVTRRVLHPVLSYQAARIASARGTPPGEPGVWRAAWVDRYGVGPEATRRERRLAKKITTQAYRADRKAAREGELMICNGVILRAHLPRLDGADTTAADITSGGGDGPIVQRKLSPAAAAMLTRARAAIAAGQLPVRPSANALRKHFGGSTETAGEVRDALADLHPLTAPTPEVAA